MARHPRSHAQGRRKKKKLDADAEPPDVYDPAHG